MDPIVAAAVAKWPGVPDAYGWLSLDARGTWWIKGSPVTNPILAGFIGRNYLADAGGRWYFQNGPQRVFVSIASAPLVVFARAGAHAIDLISHNSLAIGRITAAMVDERGALYLATDQGPAAVDDRSLAALAPCISAVADGLQLNWNGASLVIQPCTFAAREGLLRFVAEPRPAAGEAEC
jgi:hypothetical protein